MTARLRVRRSLSTCDDMEQKGLLKHGKQPLPADFWDLPRPADPQAVVRSTVLRERETGW